MNLVSKQIGSKLTKENIIKLANSVDGMISEKEQGFMIDIVKEIPSGSIVEIGSYCGKSTILLACASKMHNKSNIISIDSHEIDYFYELTLKELFWENITKAGIKDKVNLINKKSEEAVKELKESISLLFIDGDHSFEGVKKDYENFKKQIVKNGYLLFHDYADAEVRRFIDSVDFKKDDFEKVIIIDNNLFCLKKVK